MSLCSAFVAGSRDIHRFALMYFAKEFFGGFWDKIKVSTFLVLQFLVLEEEEVQSIPQYVPSVQFSQATAE